jgi:hypothetical protein
MVKIKNASAPKAKEASPSFSVKNTFVVDDCPEEWGGEEGLRRQLSEPALSTPNLLETQPQVSSSSRKIHNGQHNKASGAIGSKQAFPSVMSQQSQQEMSEPEKESDPATGSTSCDEVEQSVTSQSGSMYGDGDHSCSQDSWYFWPADTPQQWGPEWNGQPHQMPYMNMGMASRAIPFPGLVLAQPGNGYVMVDPHRHDGRMVMIGAPAYPASGYVMPSSTHAQSLPASWANVCTVMMRNLPNKITEAQLIAEIHGAGFRDTYDFMYMPIDPDTKVNRGYVFLNFTSAENAWKFRLHFEGRQISKFNSSKIVSVVPAALQGYNANQTNQAHFQTEKQAKLQRVRRRNKTQSLIDLAKSQLEQRQESEQRREDQSQEDAASSSGSGKQESGQPRHENQTEAHPPATHSSAPKWCQFCGGARMPNFKFCKFCGEAL